MADAHQVLAQQYLPTSATTVYTVPPTARTWVRHIRLHNVSATNGVVCTLYVGGTADVNRWHRVSLDAGESAEFDGILELETTQTIAALCTDASSVAMTISGNEVT